MDDVMDSRTLGALKGSILKWEKIVAGTDVDKGVSNCPLCELFYDRHGCKGCPVLMATGFSCCVGTPYQDEFVTTKRELYYAEFSGRWRDVDAAKAGMHVAAINELKFLQGLLP